MKEIIEEIITTYDMIYEIDGVEVILDTDLAKIYHVQTKKINEVVKNNPEKFPERFSFVLKDDQKENLRSKFSTANISNMSRVNPRVFTEQGIYMLATIIKSKEATHNVTFLSNNSIHDRFMILDRYVLYSCGTSFKDLGKKSVLL